jgi:hypothetical protein
MRVIITIALILCCMHVCESQSFKSEAAVPKIQQDGFYRIWISPDINVHLNDDFSDIRIYDSNNKEVSYLFQEESGSNYLEEFKEYEIVEKQHKKGCCTTLILRNPEKSPINNINLIVKNAEASRFASLLGSDDKQQWFALKDYLILNAISYDKGTFEAKIVDFPWSNYEYYLLRVDDSTFAPLNILKAGYYSTNTTEGKQTKLSPVKITSSDSIAEKKTYVRLLFNAPQFVDKLEIVASGTSKYYRRRATLSEKRMTRSKTGKREEYYRHLTDFQITSGRTATVELSGVRAQEFLITIENDDNTPLIISEIQPFQFNRYVTAWLSHEKDYTLKFGRRDLRLPVYDLPFFKDSIPATVPTLKIASIKNLDTPATKVSSSIISDKRILWVAIVTIIVVLGMMSIKMVRDTANNKDQSL